MAYPVWKGSFINWPAQSLWLHHPRIEMAFFARASLRTFLNSMFNTRCILGNRFFQGKEWTSTYKCLWIYNYDMSFFSNILESVDPLHYMKQFAFHIFIEDRFTYKMDKLLAWTPVAIRWYKLHIKHFLQFNQFWTYGKHLMLVFWHVKHCLRGLSLGIIWTICFQNWFPSFSILIIICIWMHHADIMLIECTSLPVVATFHSKCIAVVCTRSFFCQFIHIWQYV